MQLEAKMTNQCLLAFTLFSVFRDSVGFSLTPSGFHVPSSQVCRNPALTFPKIRAWNTRTGATSLKMMADRGSKSQPATDTGFDSMARHFVTYDQVAEAVWKFENELEHGRPVDRVLVAKDIQLSHWMYGTDFGEQFPNVHFHAIAHESNISLSTLGDLYVVKCKSAPHQSSVVSVIVQLHNYASSTGEAGRVMGGNMLLPGEIRRPDTAFGPRAVPDDEDPIMPRFILETEVSHRALMEADEWCKDYFSLIPQLRTVLLLQFYSRRQDRTFAALAIQYRRNVMGSIQVEDAVSFGTASLAPNAIIPSDIKKKIRTLPTPVGLVPAVPARIPSPWTAADDAFITLRAEDLFYWKISANTPLLLPNLASATPDCRISLWEILKEINEYKDF